MRSRSMFSKRIVSSARFLQMSQSAQNLYFHLGMNADDDGVVEAYTIIKMVNAAEDDFKILVAKGFIRPLNDELVTFIIDWKENNSLRSDRKVDSVYKDLLVKMIPDVELQEAKPRSDVVNNKRLIKKTPLLEAESDTDKKFTDEDIGMANLLVSLIKENNPEWVMKGNIETWASDINKLFRIDKRTYRQIEFMIRWTQKDQFWSQNILSAKKLREKFNDLIPRVKAQQRKTVESINNTLFNL